MKTLYFTFIILILLVAGGHAQQPGDSAPPIRLNYFNTWYSLAVSPDGKDLAVVPFLGSVKIIDRVSGDVKGEIEGELFEVGNTNIRDLRYSAKTGNLLIFIKKPNDTEEIIEWNVTQHKRVRVLTGKKIHAISQSEKYVLAETENGQLRLFDFTKGAQVRTFSTHELMPRGFTGAALAPDDQHLVAYNDAGQIVMISLATGKAIHEFKTPGAPGQVKALKFSGNGKYFFTFHEYDSPDRITHIWSYPERSLVSIFKGIDIRMARYYDDILNWSAEGEHLVFITNDNLDDRDSNNDIGPSVGLFDIHTQKFRRYTFPYIMNHSTKWSINQAHSAGDGKLMTLSGPTDCLIRQIDLTAENLTEIPTRINDFRVRSGAFTSDGGKLFHANHSGEIFQWDLIRGTYTGRFARLNMDIDEITCSTDDSRLIIKGIENILTDSSRTVAYTFEIASGREISKKHLGSGDIGSYTQVNGVSSSDGRFMLGGLMGPAMINNKKNQSIGLATLRGSDKDFVVFTEDGRFDGTERGISELLYAVENGAIVNIDKYRARYHTPGLLQKFLFPEMRTSASLPPSVSIAAGEKNAYRITVSAAKTGGIGPIEVYLNDRLIEEDARRLAAKDPRSLADKPSVTVILDPARLSADLSKENRLRIVSYDKGKNISSEQTEVLKAVSAKATENTTVASQPVSPRTKQAPNLWSVVIGVSSYDYPELNLRYSGRDAEAMATTLQLAGSNLFQSERTHTIKLTSECPPDQQPTKKNIEKALKYVKANAAYDDVVLIYLSGHGIAQQGNDDDFYFLASNARTADYESSEVRQSQSLSGRELRVFLNDLKAQKQVLILDACASGTFANQLAAGRDLSEAVRRGIERMSNRTATYVLAGNANDRKSYESSAYGQGLLTHTLLRGIKGAALREDKFIDISKLFQYTRDQVELISREINLVQVPVIVAPGGDESFDIGLLPSSRQRALVPVKEAKPVFKKTNLVQSGAFADLLELSEEINDKLYALFYQDNAPLVFVETDYPGAYHIAGEYSIKGNEITFRGKILRDKASVSDLAYTGPREKLSAYLFAQIEKNVN